MPPWHQLRVDPDTYAALADLAQRLGENVAAIGRDVLREGLAAYGYTFTTEPVRRNRRGEGRATPD